MRTRGEDHKAFAPHVQVEENKRAWRAKKAPAVDVAIGLVTEWMTLSSKGSASFADKAFAPTASSLPPRPLGKRRQKRLSPDPYRRRFQVCRRIGL
jgi:hypothetical protein